jgi:1-acyl-sn-glycerol-3-phosphate acyltransferase
VVNSVRAARFVAKADIARWPVVGSLVAGVGTLFIDRSTRRDAARINESIREALRSGEMVVVFPEGGGSDGARLLPFKGSLLQPVVQLGTHVQPVALRYLSPDGRASAAVAYYGNINFMQSLWSILGEREVIVEAVFTAPVHGEGRHRRELTREAEALIRSALASAADGSEPGTPDDPRRESQ